MLMALLVGCDQEAAQRKIIERYENGINLSKSKIAFFDWESKTKDSLLKTGVHLKEAVRTTDSLSVNLYFKKVLPQWYFDYKKNYTKASYQYLYTRYPDPTNANHPYYCIFHIQPSFDMILSPFER
jgi:hypothetical protein